MTGDGPEDIISGRITLHLEPYTQTFGATMERGVDTRRRRCNKQDKFTNVAFLVTFCRLGIELARLATNPGTGKQTCRGGPKRVERCLSSSPGRVLYVGH